MFPNFSGKIFMSLEREEMSEKHSEEDMQQAAKALVDALLICREEETSLTEEEKAHLVQAVHRDPLSIDNFLSAVQLRVH